MKHIWNLPQTLLISFPQVEERRPVLLVTSAPAWNAVAGQLRGLNVAVRLQVTEATTRQWDNLLTMTHHYPCEVVYAVGGGLAADAAKYIAARLNLPLTVLPTALSVDAFLTSVSGIRRASPHPSREGQGESASPHPMGEGQGEGASPLPMGESRAEGASPLPMGESRAEGASPLPAGEGQGEGASPLPMGEGQGEGASPLPLGEGPGVRDFCVHYLETKAPETLILDLETLAAAPEPIRAAGITDVLSIATGCWDWQFAHERGENPSGMDFLPWAHQTAQSILNAALDCAQAAGRGDREGLKTLYDYLALEVQLCNQIGHSRPEEGSEHYFAYCAENFTGSGWPHGDLVGPGIVVIARLQGQDSVRLEAALRACHVPLERISPEMTAQILRALPSYCRRHNLPFGIAHTLPPHPAGEDWGNGVPPHPMGEGRGEGAPPLPAGEGRGEGASPLPAGEGRGEGKESP